MAARVRAMAIVGASAGRRKKPVEAACARARPSWFDMVLGVP